MTSSPEPDPAERRSLAVSLFNLTWQLLERGDRRPADDRMMLATACASRLHWEDVGDDANLAAGDWLVAHVASRLGHGQLALDFATAAYDRASAADVPAWLRASTMEGLARAHAVLGHDSRRDEYATRCRAALEEEPDEEDRELIRSQLESIPGLPEDATD